MAVDVEAAAVVARSPIDSEVTPVIWITPVVIRAVVRIRGIIRRGRNARRPHAGRPLLRNLLVGAIVILRRHIAECLRRTIGGDGHRRFHAECQHGFGINDSRRTARQQNADDAGGGARTRADSGSTSPIGGRTGGSTHRGGAGNGAGVTTFGSRSTARYHLRLNRELLSVDQGE